jgi:hypothetical protein
MAFAICPLGAVPIKSKPHVTGELITQLLFGELAEVVESSANIWLKIRTEYDEVIGWVLKDQLTLISDQEFEKYRLNHAHVLDLFNPILSDEHQLTISLGAQLPGFDGLKFKLNNTIFRYSGQAVFSNHLSNKPLTIVKIAKKLLYVPFLGGGKTPMGMDASGMIQLLFKLIKLKLPRFVHQQVYFGELIHFIESASEADLIFFENKKGIIDHVGIYLGEGKIIHVADRVKIDLVDHFGIFDETKKAYTHKLRVIKRLLF